MKVSLDEENRFLTPDKKQVDLKQVFRYSGIKGAWCYEDGDVTPDIIRGYSDEKLIRIGTSTFADDHGTPSEHYEISLELINTPKILNMILNDQHQYTACERSLRYTKIEPCDSISEIEYALYTKWYNIFVKIFKDKYLDYFMATNANNEKKALKAMGKIAQENARNFVGVGVQTTLAYTAPFYQWQKIGVFLEEMIKNPNTELKQIAVPAAKEFVQQLKDLKVLVKCEDVINLNPKLANKITDNRELFYKNNKQIKLSMFAEDNKFSGINKPNEYGASINYNTLMSISAFAQKMRHRTSYDECLVPNEYTFVIPEIIKGSEYEQEYINDMYKVKGKYPQGQNLKVNINLPLNNLINYIGKERACTKAQREISDIYINQMLKDIALGLKDKEEYQDFYNILVNDYLDKCRCQYSDYNCPSPCGKPRTRRLF